LRIHYNRFYYHMLGGFVSITVIIPARMGSTRFPGKPLALIAGKTLIQRCCENASLARGVDRVVVATDSEKIAEEAESSSLEAIMTGPDFRTGSDRVAWVAEKLSLGPDDIVVNIQGDQPLCPPAMVEQAIRPLLDDPGLEMATLAVPLEPGEEGDPGKVKVVLDRSGNALYFSRSVIPCPRDEDAEPGYLKHLGIYAFRNSCLQAFGRLPTGILEETEKLEQLRALENGFRISVGITDLDSPSVDAPGDIERIERLLAGSK